MPVLNETTGPKGDCRQRAPRDNRLLIVGGIGRNVGKTELICRLIKESSSTMGGAITALKVSAVYPGESLWHGSHAKDEPSFQLFEETDRTCSKDTCRMLRAGATRAFYLHCVDEDVLPAYLSFREFLPNNAVIICESNSLADFIEPGLLVMVRAPGRNVKDRARRHLARADIVIHSDGRSGFPGMEQIALDKSGFWQLTRSGVTLT